MGIESGVFLLVSIATTVAGVWGLVDALIRPAAAFEAAGKLERHWWALICLGAVLVGPFFPIIGLGFVVALVVYFVDVRPAVREVQSGGRWQ